MSAEWLRIGVDGVVPIQWNVSKADDGPGSLSGWASVFNVHDLQDDVVLPGAFKKTIHEWKASGRTIPLLLDHDHRTEGIIGSMTALQETAFGLKFTAKYSSVPRAQEARTKAKEGDLRGLSIYGPVFKKAFETRNGVEVRLLQEVGLMEVSLTGFPANERAMVTAAKAGTGEAEPQREVIKLSDRWVSDMKAALAITAPTAQKAAVDSLVADMYGAAPTIGEQPSEDEASPGNDPDGDGQDEAARFALALIGESGPGESSPGGEPSDSLAELLASQEAVNVSAELDNLMAQLGKQQ